MTNSSKNLLTHLPSILQIQKLLTKRILVLLTVIICSILLVSNLQFCLSRLASVSYEILSAGQSKGSHITRYSMYEHFKTDHSKSRNPKERVLTISHSRRLARMFGYKDHQIFDAAYPDYNLLNLPFKDNQFDALFSDQVLEHVEGDPRQAFKESFRVVKPGGIIVHTTCLMNPIHDIDFWRFTPEALKLLAKEHGTVIESSGWGNRFVWIMEWLGLRYAKIPHSSWNPLNYIATLENPKWPVSTWVIAKK